MLENSQRTKYNYDRFISVKNKQSHTISTEYIQPEKMDTE